MLFEATELDGVWIIRPERLGDSRGTFARTFCMQEFAERGLCSRFSQHSMSVSTTKHTVRGLHFQKPPHQEVKLVSCVRGAILDVAVDIRPYSPTYQRWLAVPLDYEDGTQLYIPKGFAHGFQSLTDDAAVSYLISAPYAAQSACGIRFDDPAIGIAWPHAPSVISERDLGWESLRSGAASLLQETEV